jgi:hypothetical protein
MQNPPTVTSKLMGSWMMKNKPCEIAPSTSPTIIQTIQKAIHARLKKIDWKA